MYCVKSKTSKEIWFSERLMDAQYFHVENYTRKDRATVDTLTQGDLEKLKASGYTFKKIPSEQQPKETVVYH